MANLAKKVFSQINKISKKHITIISSTQCCLVFATSDFLAQKYVEKKTNIDFKRVVNFSAIGLLFVGPSSSFWFQAVNKLYARSKSSKTVVVIQKVILDQVIFAPYVIGGIVLCKNTFLGMDKKNIQLELKNKVPDLMINNYKIWPFIKLFKYNFIPLQYQVMYTQTFALMWNIYVSWKVNGSSSI